jgi:hypothetical protein
MYSGSDARRIDGDGKSLRAAISLSGPSLACDCVGEGASIDDRVEPTVDGAPSLAASCVRSDRSDALRDGSSSERGESELVLEAPPERCSIARFIVLALLPNSGMLLGRPSPNAPLIAGRARSIEARPGKPSRKPPGVS